MSVLTREDYLSRIKGRLGEELADEDISLLEDMTDTYDDLSSKVTDNTDWKAKYEELDKSWRQKYVDRFNGKVESDEDMKDDSIGTDEKVIQYDFPKTYDELFEIK